MIDDILFLFEVKWKRMKSLGKWFFLTSSTLVLKRSIIISMAYSVADASFARPEVLQATAY